MRSSRSNNIQELSNNNFNREAGLRWVQRLSFLMDSRFRIGQFRFGLDPLLNLIPFAGQILSWLISIMLVGIIMRYGASKQLLIRMIWNISWDAILGAIPVFGHVYDFFNKANQKNVKLLTEHYQENKYQGSAWPLIIGICALITLLILLVFILVYFLFSWVFDALFL